MQHLSSLPVPFLRTELPLELASHPDSLVVLGRGLGSRRMVVEVLRSATQGQQQRQRGITLVLTPTSSREGADWIVDACQDFAVVPVKIEKETVSRRRGAYGEGGGGVFIPTARMLVMDLLSGSIPPGGIATLMILDADRVDDTSNEAFCIRLAKANSPACHIQAFSTRPEKFASLIKLSQKMRLLRVSHLSLWPRNREEVQRDLNPHAPQCTELVQPLSPLMSRIQACLVEAMQFCVDELKRTSGAGGAVLDVTGLTVESNLFRAFDVHLRTQLASTWHRVPYRTKCLIRDLGVLRKLMWNLLTMDAITFFSRLLEVKEENEAKEKLEGRAAWLLHSAADGLFLAARERLWTFEGGGGEVLTMALEPDCKIQALRKVLGSIAQDQDRLRGEMGLSMELLGGVDVVVVVPDEDSRFYVQAEMCDFSHVEGEAKPWMSRLEHKFWRFLEKHFYKRDRPSFRVSSPAERAALARECDRLAERRGGKADPPGSYEMGGELLGPIGPHLTLRVVPREEQVAVCTWKDVDQGYLDRVRPRFVVSYAADQGVIREMEFMQASHPAWPLRFFMLYYRGSVEEQRFFASMKRERDAFTTLMRDKVGLTLPQAAPGEAAVVVASVAQPPAVVKRDVGTGAMVAVHPAQGGLAAGAGPHKVVVDSREIPSSLPFWLHLGGFELDIRTLEVGDYILSPRMCVERKSPTDLLGSLKRESRLLTQVPNMLRHYERTVLLIEYPDNTPFASLETYVDERKTIDFEGLMSKMTMMLLEYPDMRLLWSMTPRTTVDLFRELQHNQPPPDGDRAEEKDKAQASIGLEESHKVNVTGMNILKRMPGVTDDNVFRVARACKSLAGLSRMSAGELAPLLGSTVAAHKLVEFLGRRVEWT